MNKRSRYFDCFGYRYNHCVVLAEEYSDSNECPFSNQEKILILMKLNQILQYIVVERRGDYG